MTRLALSALAAALLVTACTKKPEPLPVTTTRTKGAPAWIDHPGIPDGLGEVGYAQGDPMGDRGLQRQTALMDGRAKLAAQIKVKVQNVFSQLNQRTTTAATEGGRKPIKGDVMQRMVENVTRNLVEQELQGSRAAEIWHDENGDLYIHVVISKETLDAALKQQANQAIRKEIQEGERSLEEALDRLDAALAAAK